MERYENLDPDTYQRELVEMGASREDAETAAQELRSRQKGN